MKRVLIVGMHDKIGGVETFIMNYYRNIDKSKIQFDFINMFDKLCFENEILRLGSKIYKVPNVKRNPIKYYTQIKNIIKRNKYEIVHINMLSMANVLPILCAKKAKTKCIIAHSHNTNTPKGFLRKILDKLNRRVILNDVTDLFACSEIAGKWMFGENKEFKVINNAIDVNKFKFNEEKRNKMREELNLGDEYLIGHIGRFCEQKNHHFLIDLFYSFITNSNNNKSKLLLIGEGELKEEIKEKVKAYKIEEKVIFLDPIANVYDYMQAMDVFLLPSKFEGLPVVAVEAQMNGLKVITSDTVSKDLPIKELSVYCSLNNIEEWIAQLKYTNIKRYDRTEDIIESNYDISIEAKRLQEYYEKR